MAGALANLGKIVQAMISPEETDKLYKQHRQGLEMVKDAVKNISIDTDE